MSQQSHTKSAERKLNLFPTAIFLVTLSGLVHAVWNLFAKQSLNKVAFIWSLQGVAVMAYLPWALIDLEHHHVPIRGWVWLAAAVAVHGAYVVMLSRTYALGDLSHVYPLMRGVGPLLVPIIGVFLLSERLPTTGWLGVAAIVTGILLLGNWRHNASSQDSRLSPKATWIALAVGIAITGYTTLDKIALEFVPAVTLNDASNLANLSALTWVAIRSAAIRTEWSVNWKTILLCGILSPGGYLLFLLALHIAPVAQLAPMREIGTVFGTVLGVFVLRESQGRRRLSAAGLITVGAVILGIWG